MATSSSIPNLPADIYHLILSRLNHPQTLARCLQTATQLNEVASASSLWEPLYRDRYRHCLSFKEDRRRDACQGSYYLMYAYRRRLDMAAIDHLQSIVANRNTRLGRAEKLVEMSWDVWDALQAEAYATVPSIFTDVESSDRVPCHSLTRRFWAENILGVIARRFAAESTWTRLVRDDSTLDQDASLVEDALSSLSVFFGKSPYLIADRFGEMADRCREFIQSSGCTLTSTGTGEDLKRTCVLICDFMRAEGYGPLEASGLSVLQLFPHNYTSGNKHTIPICLCHVFVAIARRLGIPAKAVAFPSRVIVRITAPPEADDFFVDVYGSRQKALLSLHGDIPPLLNQANIPLSSATNYLAPASASLLLNRAVQNIFNARDEEPNPMIDGPADYAALCIIVMSGEGVNNQLIQYMLSCVNVSALDSKTFLIPSFAPLLRPGGRLFLTDACEASIKQEEEDSKTVKRRENQNDKVLYSVGTFFRHKKYGYLGLIYHWDYTCCASTAWITQMGIHNLNRGSSQPFYNAMTADSGSSRYVAEENIEPTGVDPAVVKSLYENYPIFARWFSDVDEVGDDGKIRKMVLSPESRDMFPDDFS